MGLSLKINMNADAEKPLLLHPSFQEILRRERIELYNPSRTVVASYGVCYNGMAIDASTKIGAVRQTIIFRSEHVLTFSSSFSSLA